MSHCNVHPYGLRLNDFIVAGVDVTLEKYEYEKIIKSLSDIYN